MKEFLICLACVAAVVGMLCLIPLPKHRPMPRFIAHACDGAGGDLWAMDASDFPTRCKEIEEY